MNNVYDCFVGDKTNHAILCIEDAKAMYETQVTRARHEEYLKNLAFADYVATVKRNKSRYDMFPKLFVAAWGQAKEKKKSERKDLSVLEEFLREDFFNGDKRFKVDHLVCGGYAHYYWDVYFTFDCEEFKDQVFYIGIPMMDNIDVKNFDSARKGRFAFYIQESQFVWTAKESSYRIEDIANYIKEYFKVDWA